MWTIVSKTIDRCFAVLGAFVFCQLPLFMQQYSMLLSGHLAESRRNMNLLQHVAALSNKSLQEYIQKFLGQQDLDFVQQGELMQSMQVRYESLNASYSAIQETSVWTKPFVFMTHLDKELFWDTLGAFTPGIGTNLETLIYAVIGLVVGVVTFRLFAKLISWVFSLFSRSSKALTR